MSPDTVGDDLFEQSLEERLEAWRNEQYRIASQVVVLEDPPELNSDHRFKKVPLTDTSLASCYYGGVDVSFPATETDPAVAVYVIMSTQKVVYRDHLYFSLEVPYIPSYLSFREMDPLEQLVRKQVSEQPTLTPRVILVDGNGILHPRGAGIACFLGVRTGIPTIGVGKSLYCEAGLSREVVQHGIDASLEALRADLQHCAEWKSMLKKERVLFIDKQCIDASVVFKENAKNDRTACIQELSESCGGVVIKLRGDNGQILAAALLGHGGGLGAGAGTRKPIYISVGHNISLEQAVKICASLSLARIPEPVRQADLSGRELLRKNKTVN